MNIIHKVTWKGMWKNRIRTLVTVFSVVLSAAMFMAVVTLVYSLQDYVLRTYTYRSGDYYVEFRYSSDEQYEALKEEPDVEYVADFKVLGYHAFYHFIYGYKIGEDGTMPLGAVDREFLEHMAIPLIEGRLPENSSEILLPLDYYDRYELNELPTASIGDTITLNFINYVSSDISASGWNEDIYAEQFGLEYTEVEKTFTVVGIVENRSYNTKNMYYQSFSLPILTVSDGNEGEILWHKLFVKTKSIDAAYHLAEKEYGGESYLNEGLIKVESATGMSTSDIGIAVTAAVLLLIVLVATVSPIRNAFSISISERTLQFGLMNSVGMTKKQMRRSVLFEALSVAAIGIPVGLLCGYGITEWMINTYGNKIVENYAEMNRVAMFGYEGMPEFDAVVSWTVILVTVLICLVTILLAVSKPARRAVKITPVEAIRQQKDIKIRASKLRIGKVTRRLFGLPGILAKQYYRVSRKKYRATVVSISVSLLLFIVINYLGDSFKLIFLDQGALPYEFSYQVKTREELEGELEYAKALPGVTRAEVLHVRGSHSVNIPNRFLTNGYREIYSLWNQSENTEEGWSRDTMYIYFLEDEDFERYLTAEGIDPEPYLSSTELLAVTVSRSYSAKIGVDEEGNRIYRKYFGPMIENGGAVYLISSSNRLDHPSELHTLYDDKWHNEYEILSEMTSESYTSNQGENIIKMTALVAEGEGAKDQILGEFLVESRIDLEKHQLVFEYYEYDKDRGKISECILTKSVDAEHISVGESLSQCPFGFDVNEDGETLLMPYSQMPEKWRSRGYTEIRIKTHDYLACAEALEKRAEKEYTFSYDNGAEKGYFTYMMIDVARTIINGLTLLVALMSAANVFNTITANIALRRRDFGMLRSIGMTQKDVNRMMGFECLRYWCHSIFIGIPLGLLGCGITYYCMYKDYETGVGFPWQTVCLGLAMVFLIVFASAFYAVARLRKDTPIDAIRMDNL